ncbi:MAG TPA: riboflavin synthase [Sedimentisphaerales bacterium]|nr:riboflavin synthase [Sedimentisphaerales bacterium]
MFTGLIEAVCPVASVRRRGGGMELTVDLGRLAEDAAIGDSIAINGVCLTISRLKGSLASFDLSGETLAKSTLGKLQVSAMVNVELALKATDRLGGHIVQGHIDGIATIKRIDKQGQFADITFAVGPELLDVMVVKDSVAVNGISLTITDVGKDCFSAALIPETLNKTTLGKARMGDLVNIEVDIIAKLIKKQLEKVLAQEGELTEERLRELGF